MKKLFLAPLLFLLFLSPFLSLGQSWSNPAPNTYMPPTASKYTIFPLQTNGTTTRPVCFGCGLGDTTYMLGENLGTWGPSLLINGGIRFLNRNVLDSQDRLIQGWTITGNLSLYNAGSWEVGSGIRLYGQNDYKTRGSVYFAQNVWTSEDADEEFAFNWGYFNQTTFNWTTQMAMMKNGNLGIADSLPEDKLTVNGDVGFTASSGVTRRIKGNTTNNYLEIASNTSEADGSSIVLHSNDNVGISDVSPSEKLTINGDMAFTAGSGLRKILGRSSSNSLQIFSNTNATDGSAITLNNNGNVGINDAAPQERITVGGDIGFTPSSSDARHLYGNSSIALTIAANRNTSGSTGSVIQMFGEGHSTDPKSLKLLTDGGSEIILNGNATGNGTYQGSGQFNSAGTGSTAFEFTNSNTSSSLLQINTDGKVGIGDANPSDQLTVNGDISFTSSSSARKLMGQTSGALELCSFTDNSNGSTIVLQTSGLVQLNALGSVWSNLPAFEFNVGSTPMMSMNTNGEVAIGSNAVSFLNGGGLSGCVGCNYRLLVEGGILTESIVWKSIHLWPDYVFSNNYKLKTLEELDKYIGENHHLPEIPTQDEVSKNGVNLGEMSQALLKKVEELTLYVIQQQKEIDELKNKIK